MRIACESDGKNEPSGFIGYKQIKKAKTHIVRIYLNCKDESHFEGQVDVIFKKGKPKFSGLSELSTIKKFHRFIGCLEERANDAEIQRERVFESSKQLLYLLSKVKNSKNFDVKKGM